MRGNQSNHQIKAISGASPPNHLIKSVLATCLAIVAHDLLRQLIMSYKALGVMVVLVIHDLLWRPILSYKALGVMIVLVIHDLLRQLIMSYTFLSNTCYLHLLFCDLVTSKRPFFLLSKCLS